MKYLSIYMKGDWFVDEFGTAQEAIDRAAEIFNHLTEREKEAAEGLYVLESVNPDEEADNHLDGDVVRDFLEEWKVKKALNRFDVEIEDRNKSLLFRFWAKELNRWIVVNNVPFFNEDGKRISRATALEELEAYEEDEDSLTDTASDYWGWYGIDRREAVIDFAIEQLNITI
jgi:hypothetical protein